MDRSLISFLGRQLLENPHKNFTQAARPLEKPGNVTQRRWRSDPQRNTLWNWSRTAEGKEQLQKPDLKDIDESIRLKCAVDVSKLGVLVTQKQAALLKHQDVRLRRSAARLLGIMGVSAAAQAESLVHAIMDVDEEVRSLAIWALGQCGPAAAARSRSLLANLHPRSEQFRDIVYRAGLMLDKFVSQGPHTKSQEDSFQDFRFTRVKKFRTVLHEKSISAPDLRQGCRIPNVEERVKTVRQEMRSDNPAIRHLALQLVQSVNIEAIPMPPWELASQLAHMFDDVDERVRQEAARAFARMTHAAGNHLAHRVSDENVHVRRDAMSSLLEIGAAAAPHVDVIHQRLKDSNAQIRADAALSLKAIGVVSVAMESHLCKGYREDCDPVVRRCNKSALEAVLPSRDRMTWRRKPDDPRAVLQRWMDKSAYK